MKVKLHSLHIQWFILFIPIVNLYYTLISANQNMRKLKDKTHMLYFTLVFLGSVIILGIMFSLLSVFNIYNQQLLIALRIVIVYITLFIIALGFLVVHTAIINKRIFNGDIIIENKKMYLVKNDGNKIT